MKSSVSRLSDWSQWVLAWVMLGFFLPIMALLSAIIVILTGWPIFYIQKRVGKYGKIFRMIKFRTMINGADGLKNKYIALNEADGPVFKIKNDPRFTMVGKFLCHSGLDELPQLVNIILGQMNIVGPRPLPIEEYKEIPTNFKRERQLVKPGILSTWVLNGHHKMTFQAWMTEDIKYIRNRSFFSDVKILCRCVGFFVGIVFGSMISK